MKVSKANAEHYIWGDVCDGWLLVNEPERSIIQERMPVGSREVRHYHTRAKQFFFVISGTLTLEIGGEIVTLNRNEGISVPTHIPHQARNESDMDTEFLVISQPTTRGDRINV